MIGEQEVEFTRDSHSVHDLLSPLHRLRRRDLEKENTTMAPPSPSLYRLLSEAAEWRDHDLILAHIEDHAEDLVWADRYGNTALHKLCKVQDPTQKDVQLVEQMVRRRQDLVSTPNGSGWTPLHLVCEKRMVLRQGSAQTQMALLLANANPTAVSIKVQTGFKRMTPFHLACEANAEIKVLRAMLGVNPSLATQPCVSEGMHTAGDDSPVEMVWKHHDMHKMALLLLTAFEGHVVEPLAVHHLLHAACFTKCPRDYFSRIVRKCPNQASQPDDTGNLPLHHAVRRACVESQTYTQFILEELLQVYQEACSIPDDTGRLALHVALSDSRLTWHKGGIDLLVRANPDALYTVDTTSGLYPFLTSSLYATQSRLHLSTTYNLLLAAPSVVRHALE
jgi:ankyrin repeat protein